MRVTDNLGREYEYTEKVKESIFNADVEVVMYLLKAGIDDEEVYQTTEAIFQDRRGRGIPGILTKELFYIYKDAAKRHVENTQRKIESDEILEGALSKATTQRSARAIQEAVDIIRSRQ